MTPYGRREGWEDNPEGWPEAPQADSPVGGHGSPICWYWRSDANGVATWGPTSRPVPQWTRPAATPWRPSAATTTTTDGPSSTAAAKPLGAGRKRRACPLTMGFGALRGVAWLVALETAAEPGSGIYRT
jgi:hypothetical protein